MEVSHILAIYFNSQPHKEADDGIIADGAIRSDFNSQPHKEADKRLKCYRK